MVPEEQEHKVPENKILAEPMRYVRTSRAKADEMRASMSRFVLPGHRDPQLGLYRTDAPTTSGLAIYVMAVIVAARGWLAESFDVTTAFLTDLSFDRDTSSS